MAIDPNNLSATAVMTFDDEFNTLNLFNGTSGTWDTKYAFQGASGGGLPGEQEWYINSLYSPTSAVKPWTVSNGVLTITAAPADPSIQPLINNSQYTSGIITTFHSFSQTYGYFEIRAELPKGQGFWPAFWLLPADQTWPPEIDVFEVLGKDTSTLYTTVHTNSTGTHTQSGIGTQVADTSVGFHTYGVDWESDYITWYYDGRQVYKTATPADLVNKPMYMLANLGLGGSWGGPVDSTTPWPAQFQIDYIRAYSAGPAGGTSTPPPPTPPTTPPPTTGGGSGQVLTANDSTTPLIGGPGNDTLIAGRGGANLTGGGGADIFQFKAIPWSAGHITDFTPGVDKLDLSALFTAANYHGSNPVADGYLSFVSDGAGGTRVMLDTDGYGSANPWPFLITTLDNVPMSSLQPSDWIYSTTSGSTPPSSTPSTPSTPPTTPPPTTGGGTAGVVLTATDGGSVLTGGAGNDTLIAGHGADTLTGGAGSDTFQFNYLPWSAGHITDFTSGVDKIDLSPLFTASNYQGSDPVGDGYLNFVSDGAGGTKIMFDPDGFGAANPWPFLITDVQNVSNLQPTDWIYKAGTTGASSGAGGTASSGGAVPGVVLTGNDFGATLVGGAGSDTLIAGHGAFTMTGGGGSDTFQFNVLPWSAGHITDFTPGVDHLDFHSLFAASGYTGSDPIRDGYLSFATDAAGGTKIYFDPDGFGSANPWPTLMTTLDHVSLNNPMDWFLH